MEKLQQARASLEQVRFEDLDLGATLGEGTSSVVRRARLHGV